MDLKEIEKELRTIADFVRDNPKETVKISFLIKNLHDEADKSRLLYEPALIKKKEFLEKEKEVILASKKHVENATLKLEKTDEDLVVKQVLEETTKNQEMALLVLNEEIKRIENALK